MKKLILSLVALMGVMTLSAQSVSEIFNAGAGLYNEGKFAEAASKFEQVVAEGDLSEDAAILAQVDKAKNFVCVCYRKLGASAAKQKNYEEALAQFSKSVERAEEYGNKKDKDAGNAMIANVYQAQGGEAFNNKDWAAAASIFEKGYEANPRNTKMANWLGTCYCEMGQYEKGMEILGKVAANKTPRAAEDAAEANRLMAIYTTNHLAALQEAKDYNGLIALAEQMLVANAADATAHKVRLQAYQSLGNNDKVIELAESAAAAQTLEEEKSDIYFSLGAAYTAKQMKAEALSALQKVTAGAYVENAKSAIADLSK